MHRLDRPSPEGGGEALESARGHGSRGANFVYIEIWRLATTLWPRPLPCRAINCRRSRTEQQRRLGSERCWDGRTMSVRRNTAWVGSPMRSRPPLSNAVGQRVTITDRLIALGVLLCLGILIGASGPHLVHHLADLHPGPPHQQTHTSQPPDCLVLSLMQHIPLAGDFFTSLPVFLSTAEQASCAQPLQATATPRPTVQARSPPIMSHS
jgi:hypothetical protein